MLTSVVRTGFIAAAIAVVPIGVAVVPAASAQNMSAEDGLAIVLPAATFKADGSVRVKLKCFPSEAKTACSGTFQLKLKGQEASIAGGNFDDLASGETVVVKTELSTAGRKYAKKRCKFTVQAVVEPKNTGTSIEDVAQEPVRLTRKGKGC